MSIDNMDDLESGRDFIEHEFANIPCDIAEQPN